MDEQFSVCSEDKQQIRPDYYKRGGIEVWDVIDAWGLDFDLGCALKYIMLAGYKGDAAADDPRKAITYVRHALGKMGARADG